MLHYLWNISEQAKMMKFGCAVFMFACLLSCTEQVGVQIKHTFVELDFDFKNTLHFYQKPGKVASPEGMLHIAA